jgi:hypothetical protein
LQWRNINEIKDASEATLKWYIEAVSKWSKWWADIPSSTNTWYTANQRWNSNTYVINFEWQSVGVDLSNANSPVYDINKEDFQKIWKWALGKKEDFRKKLIDWIKDKIGPTQAKMAAENIINTIDASKFTD